MERLDVGSAVFMLIWQQPHCSHAASLSVSLSRGAVLVLIFDISVSPPERRAHPGVLDIRVRHDFSRFDPSHGEAPL